MIARFLVILLCCATACQTTKHLLSASDAVVAMTQELPNTATAVVANLIGRHAVERIQSQQQISYDNNVDKGDDVAAAGINTHDRVKRQVSDWLIAPNTRWCGRGNLANGTYNHLGGASSADKCCRKHDHCKLFIPAMSNRYELFNYRPYTLSHCMCDRRFRTCLKMANDEDAKTIGKLFFNMVQTQCFVLTTERICQVRSTDGSGDCLREQVRHKAYLKNNKKF